MPEETKNEEILEAINTFANHTQKEFESIKTEVNEIKSEMRTINSEMQTVKSEMQTVKSEMQTVKSEMGTIKAEMVTKDYLDEKLADLRGDLVVLTRKEDKKVMILVDILKDHKLINEDDVKRIQSMEPFAQSI